jgi:signal transduction histidine kinase
MGAAQLRQSLGVSRSGLVEKVSYFALSPSTFAIYGAFVVIATGLRAYRWVPDIDSVSLVVLVALGTIAFVATVARVLREWVPKAKLWIAALLLWVSMAVVRHLAEVSVSQIELGSEARVTGMSFVLSIGSALVWMILIAGLQGLNEVQRTTTQQLQTSIEQLRKETERRWLELDAERSRLTSLVQRTITPALKELISVVSERDLTRQSAGFADLVSSVVEDSRNLVREASHEMKQLAQRSAALGQPLLFDLDSSETHSVKRPVLATANIRVEPGAALVALPALGLAAPAPVPATVVRLILAVAVGFAVLSLISWILSRFRLPDSWLALLIVTVGNAIGVASGVFVSGALIGSLVASTPETVWLLPGSSPWFEGILWILGTVVTTAVSLMVADRREWRNSALQLAQMRDSLNELDMDMRRQCDRMAAQTASMLHGPIQGRLATVGMTLRFAGDQISEKDLATIDALLRACEVDLVRAALDPRGDRVSAAQVLDALGSQWAGLMTITWTLTPDVSDEINNDPLLVRSLETLVADLASNASRHGGAKEVHLEISLSRSHLHILARDNGSGPTLPMQPGIGLGAIDPSHPSIYIDPDGWCCVTAAISRADPEGSVGAGSQARSRNPSEP